MKKVPVHLQLNQNECGLCCCNMILNYHGSRENIFRLREEFETGRDGLNILDLKKVFINRGFNSKIYKANLAGLTNVELPCILFWDYRHFVVLEKISKKSFYIIDPYSGRKKYNSKEFSHHFSDYVLTVSPTNNIIVKKDSKVNPWKPVFKLVKLKKLNILFLVLLTVLSLLSTLFLPFATQKIIDYTVNNKDISDIYNIFSILMLICFLFLIISIFKGLLTVSLNVFINRELISDTFFTLLNIPYKFFSLRSPGDLLYRINSLNAIKELISNSVIPGFINIGLMIIIFIYLYAKSSMIFLVTIFLIFLNLLILFSSRKYLKLLIDDEIAEQSKNQSIITEILNSILFIKISALESDFFKRWKTSFNKALNKFSKRSIVQEVINTLTQTLQIICPCIILIVGVVLYKKEDLSLGEVVAIQSIVTILFSQTSSIFSAYTQTLMTTSYLNRVLDITETYKYTNTSLYEDNKKKIHITGSLSLENVTFSYSNMKEKSIKNVNLHLNIGEKIAIVGKSGSGKSTLAKIIVGLFKIDSGRVLIDNENIENIDQKNLHSQISIVPQDTVLFNKNIIENITVGNEPHDINDIKRAAKIAEIHEEIEKMPMGYFTNISDMGMNLSGGQRQRIAIARAILKMPKILILDEATSSLDQENERLILSNLQDIGCSIIMVSHRLSTVKDAEYIYVMKDGSITEEGNHQSLIQQDGYYKKMYIK